jgi:hypothetical protein
MRRIFLVIVCVNKWTCNYLKVFIAVFLSIYNSKGNNFFYVIKFKPSFILQQSAKLLK